MTVSAIDSSNAIPTHIFTGFLGSGKTTAILHLLANKPDDEHWAILVNEFGEIGIDGSLLQGQTKTEQQVSIREVPGGCMCCASGLPMQIALNQLIQRAKPDRLFIEPTGLGHPHEVIEVLSAEHYQNILSLQRIITLVDARHLSDERYRQHKTFQQQIAIADLVVGNKQDLYHANEATNLEDFVQEYGKQHAEIIFTQQGKLGFDQINGYISDASQSDNHLTDTHSTHHHAHASPSLASDQTIPACGYLSAQNQGEGFASIGWRFSSDFTFNKDKLFVFLSGLNVERMKGVFKTDQGNFSYNLSDHTLTEKPLFSIEESRAEIIAREIDDSWEEQLLLLKFS